MIKNNIIKINQALILSCQKVKREPQKVKILAATKYRTTDEIAKALSAGIKIIGESKVQELNDKIELLPQELRVDFIGHLQSNKVNDVVKSCVLIHSVDSLKIAEKINLSAERINKRQPVLLEINVSGEESKSGFGGSEIMNVFPQIYKLANLKVIGLMTMAPHFDDPEETRSIFIQLRMIRDKLENKYQVTLPELSMGMSNDYQIAIEEGATIIRLGRIIFE